MISILSLFALPHVDVIRGVYLATVFYHKENILVTAEDQIPLVEIQCCSTSITQDFLWFAKVKHMSTYMLLVTYPHETAKM